ncbi:MAG: hypothetical protein ACRD4D_04570 [Candidatus Acidiferrales bacterium]
MPANRELIQVKYTEDLAQFAETRPVRRQPMTLKELVGLVLTSTGKQPGRIAERLQSGTCTYNIYRYWWDGFALDPAALAALLAEFPDPEPARPFRPESCVRIHLLDSAEPVPRALALEKAEAARRRWFQRRSCWDLLLEFAGARAPGYVDYSYYHRADLYRVSLAPADRAWLVKDCRRLAARSLARQFDRGLDWVAMELACKR